MGRTDFVSANNLWCQKDFTEVEWEGNMISHMAITQQCVDTDHLICQNLRTDEKLSLCKYDVENATVTFFVSVKPYDVVVVRISCS